MRLVIRGGRVIDPASGLDEVQDVVIEDGYIAAVGPAGDGGEVLDARGLVVVPGLIDMHVHLREPGQEHKETVATGTRAAAAGGFTAVAAMANTEPPVDDPTRVEYVRAIAARQGVVRVYPIAAITKGLKGEELAEIGALKQAGAVALSDDGRSVPSAGVLRRAMQYTRMIGLPIIEHCEDPELSGSGVMHEGAISTELGLAGIPAASEDVIVARDLILAESTGAHLHVAHVSTKGAVELIRAAKARGVRVTAEVTPHHFTLTAEAVRTYDTNTKMKPPLRDPEDIAALIGGLQDGTIDCIATDHAPHSFDEKDVEYDYAPFGIVGLETAVSLTLTHLVHAGHLSLIQALCCLTVHPARILGVPGGRLAAGEPADLTLVDLDAEVAVDRRRMHSLSTNTPFHGWRLKGRAVATIVGGQPVMRDGELVEASA